MSQKCQKYQICCHEITIIIIHLADVTKGDLSNA